MNERTAEWMTCKLRHQHNPLPPHVPATAVFRSLHNHETWSPFHRISFRLQPTPKKDTSSKEAEREASPEASNEEYVTEQGRRLSLAEFLAIMNHVERTVCFNIVTNQSHLTKRQTNSTFCNIQKTRLFPTHKETFAIHVTVSLRKS